MFQVSRRGDYAVRAVLYLAARPLDEVTLVNDISEEQDIPKSYLSKIMQDLTRVGIARSRRGSSGGFMLAREPETITVREVVEAIEGPVHLNLCLTGKSACHRDLKCPTHPLWRFAQEKLIEALESKNFAELVREGKELEKGIEAG